MPLPLFRFDGAANDNANDGVKNRDVDPRAKESAEDCQRGDATDSRMMAISDHGVRADAFADTNLEHGNACCLSREHLWIPYEFITRVLQLTCPSLTRRRVNVVL